MNRDGLRGALIGVMLAVLAAAGIRSAFGPDRTLEVGGGFVFGSLAACVTSGTLLFLTARARAEQDREDDWWKTGGKPPWEDDDDA